MKIKGRKNKTGREEKVKRMKESKGTGREEKVRRKKERKGNRKGGKGRNKKQRGVELESIFILKSILIFNSEKSLCS